MKKLLSLVFISLFLVGLFAFAKDGNENEDNNQTGDRQESEHTGKENKKVFTGLSADAIACVTTAVVARDTAIKGGMAAYDATWLTTFDARTAAFTAALSLTDRKEMKKAMESAWKTSEKAMKSAQKVKKGVVQTAWGAYRTALKACSAPIAKDLMLERGGNDLDD